MKNQNKQGFTIIEVLIVLAIAGLIMVIVFLAVPTLQRNSRNFQRKHAANQMAGSLAEYYNNNAQTYPENPTAMCNFFNNFVSGIGTLQGGCTPSYSGDCVVVNLTRFNVCYHEGYSSPHSYIGDDDEISVVLGHWCNTGAHYYAGDGTNPITDGGIANVGTRVYAVWIQLEKAPVYCLDNR